MEWANCIGRSIEMMGNSCGFSAVEFFVVPYIRLGEGADVSLTENGEILPAGNPQS
jgi:hypothetical protein